jgi:uncharacterized protein (DUF1778 family)
MLQAGKVQKGGQDVGMPDIPAVPFGSPYGAFESIHGCESSKEFAEDLEAACKKYRGSAIDEFLTDRSCESPTNSYKRKNVIFDNSANIRIYYQ